MIGVCGWWDDALELANRMAADTQMRHRVYRLGNGWWGVGPVMYPARRLAVVR